MLLNYENIVQRNQGAFHAVSLFSNCGAGDVGYKKSGFRFDVMAELNLKRLEVCLLNHPGAVGVQGDLRETWPEVVDTYRIKTENAPLSLLAACPPCQGMSSARGLRGAHEDADAGSKDERNLLAVVIAKVANELNPKIIVVENVPEFLSKKVRHPDTNEPVTASNLLIELLTDRYRVFPIVLDFCDFGIPQSRKRSFMTFVRQDIPGLNQLIDNDLAPFPVTQGKPVSLARALKGYKLPELDGMSQHTSRSLIKKFTLHTVPVLTPSVYRMIQSIPPNSGKSAWENNLCPDCQFLNSDNEVVCLGCRTPLPKPLMKEPDGSFRLIKGFKTSYKRMDPFKPAATVLTTSGSISSHNTLHPYENRVLSILECMKLQTFGMDFKWGNTVETWGEGPIRKMIGEAVPPKFTQLHGQVLLGILENTNPVLLSSKDRRCVLARTNLRKAQKVEVKLTSPQNAPDTLSQPS